MDTVFREKQVSQSEAPPKAGKSVGSPVEDGVEIPFSAYKDAKGKPYSVEYFDLGDQWEVFGKDIDSIEGYLSHRIETGDLADTQASVKKHLKQMEKDNDLKGDERTVIKIGTLASYARFLLETDSLKWNERKYAYK